MFARFALGLCLVCGSGTVVGGQPPVCVFPLRDRVNQTWQHELVFFPVPQTVYGRTDLQLVDSEKKPVAHQWVPAASAPS